MPQIWTEDNFMYPLLDQMGQTLFDPQRSLRNQNLATSLASHELALKQKAEQDAAARAAYDAQLKVFRLQFGRDPTPPEAAAIIGTPAPPLASQDQSGVTTQGGGIVPTPPPQSPAADPLRDAQYDAAVKAAKAAAAKGDVPGMQQQFAIGGGLLGGAETPQGRQRLDISRGNQPKPLADYSPDQLKENERILAEYEKRERAGQPLTRDQAIDADRLLGATGTWKEQGGRMVFTPRDPSKFPMVGQRIEAYRTGAAPGPLPAPAGAPAAPPGFQPAPAPPSVGPVADVPGETLRQRALVAGTEPYKNLQRDRLAYDTIVKNLQSNDREAHISALEQLRTLISPTPKSASQGTVTQVAQPSGIAGQVDKILNEVMGKGGLLTPKQKQQIANLAYENFSVQSRLAKEFFDPIAEQHRSMGLDPKFSMPPYLEVPAPPTFEDLSAKAKPKAPGAPLTKRIDELGTSLGLW